MRDIPFEEIITVQLWATGDQRNVASVIEAIDCLVQVWPNNFGPKTIVAKKACISALKRNLSGRSAEIAFLEAAKEAHIYVDRTAARPSFSKK